MLDLEDLIYEVAEHKRDGDFHDLCLRMKDREVFVPIFSSSLPKDARPGHIIKTDSSHCIRMRTAVAPNGQGMVAAATQQESPLLKEGYIGMSWIGLLEMAFKVQPPLYGILLQGHRSWVAFDLERVRRILQF